MFADQNKLVVKSKGKLLSSKKTFEIMDPETGEVMATAKYATGFITSLLGGTIIEIRDTDNKLLFSVGRTGLLMKKDQVKNSKGEVIGRYKSKKFSLSGGFHVYDQDGKHVAEIKGKMFKSEFKFVSPDKTTEIGSVTKQMGGIKGLAKSLLADKDTYALSIDPKYGKDSKMKMVMLGATIALESIFQQKGKGGLLAVAGAGAASGDDESEE